MGKGEYESIICVDLRSFDRTAEDMGVNAYFKQLGFVPTGLCFLNFQVMYLFDFENVDDRELDPICTGQNGTPCGQVWTNRELYRLITYIRSCGVRAYLGFCQIPSVQYGKIPGIIGSIGKFFRRCAANRSYGAKRSTY